MFHHQLQHPTRYLCALRQYLITRSIHSMSHIRSRAQIESLEAILQEESRHWARTFHRPTSHAEIELLASSKALAV